MAFLLGDVLNQRHPNRFTSLAVRNAEGTEKGADDVKSLAAGEKIGKLGLRTKDGFKLGQGPERGAWSHAES